MGVTRTGGAGGSAAPGSSPVGAEQPDAPEAEATDASTATAAAPVVEQIKGKSSFDEPARAPKLPRIGPGRPQTGSVFFDLLGTSKLSKRFALSLAPGEKVRLDLQGGWLPDYGARITVRDAETGKAIGKPAEGGSRADLVIGGGETGRELLVEVEARSGSRYLPNPQAKGKLDAWKHRPVQGPYGEEGGFTLTARRLDPK